MLNQLVQHCLRSWRHHGVTQLATMTSLVMGFSFFLLTLLATTNLNRIVTLWGDQPEISVFLQDDLKVAEVKKLEEELKSQPHVRDLRFISSEEALAGFKAEFSEVAPELFADAMLESPFPASFVVRLSHAISSPKDYDWLVERATVFQNISGVSEVSFGKNWVENYSNFVGALKILSGLLIALLLVACQFMIANSIRASVEQRREEILIKELLGADGSDVRAPFLVEGTLSAALAGLISLGAMALLFESSRWFLQREFPLLRLTERLEFFSPALALGFLALFAGVGFLGSFFVVRKVGLGWLGDDV